MKASEKTKEEELKKEADSKKPRTLFGREKKPYGSAPVQALRCVRALGV